MKRTALAALCLIFSAQIVMAQVATGVPPFSSWSGGQFDNVNLGNLNVHFTIPIIHKAGRGLPFNYDMNYDSSIWSATSVGYSGSAWTPATNWGWKSSADMGKITFYYQVNDCYNSQWGYPDGDTWYEGGFTYIDGQGTHHNFSGMILGYDPGSDGNCSGTSQPSFTSTATDGSGLTISVEGGPNYAYALITTPDGVSFSPPISDGSFSSGGGAGITDSNGNQLSGAYTDTTGTTALTISGSAPTVTYTYPGPSGNQQIIFNYIQYTVQTNFGCSGVSEYGPQLAYLLDNIALPDGTKYKFAYEQTPGGSSNVTGRLASITLPTGGSISYQYGSNCPGAQALSLTRTVNPGAYVWQYNQNWTGQQWETKLTTPTNDYTNIFFENGYETQRSYYQANGTLLQTVTTCYNGNTANCPSSSPVAPIKQRAVITQWPNGLQSETATFYDPIYSIITEIKNYDYGSGSPGPLMRDQFISYASLGSIHDRPSAVTVFGGSSNLISDTLYRYDENTLQPTSVTQHVAVSQPRGNLTTLMRYATISGGSASNPLTQTFQYYDTGMLYSSTDVNGAATTYSGYQCNGAYPSQINYPLGLSTSEVWDCNGGVPTSTTDMNSNTTTYSYDGMWRPLQTVFPDGGETSKTYNLSSNPPNIVTQQQIDSQPRFLKTTTIFDGFGQITEQQANSNPLGTVNVDTTYDGLGRVATVTNPYVSTSDPTYGITKYFYDALNRPTSVSNPDGSTKLMSYTGRATEMQDEGNGSSRVTKIYQSDGLGRLASVCEVTSAGQLGSSGTPSACGQDIAATGFLTSYTHDTLGNLTSVAQNGLQPRTYSYDAISRLLSETNPESGTTTYTYDSCSAGDLCTRVRPKANQTNPAVTTTTSYSYDALHRLTTRSYDDGLTPTDYFSYDTCCWWDIQQTNTKGRLQEAWAGESCCATSGATNFSYDAMGRVNASEQYAQEYLPFYFTYDLAGDLATASSGWGWTYTYNYNTAQQLNGIASSLQDPTHPGSLLSNVQYNPLGEETSATMGNGTNGAGIGESFTYDNRGRIMAHSSGVLGGPGNWGISGVNYAPDNDPLGLWDSALGGTWSYSYDDFNRLASSSGNSNYYGNVSFNYAYDRFGNRWQQNAPQGGPAPQYLFNSNNQISGSGVQYDSAGNITNDGLGHTYTYDAEGHVLTVDSGATASYKYDPFGRRVESTVSGNTVDYAYDSAGHVILEYQPGLSIRLEVYQPDSGRHLATYADSETFFDFQDMVGTEQLKITQDGSAYESNASLPFGDDVLAWGSGLGDTGPTRFSGQEWDSETNLTHFWFRQLSTTQSRWMTPDPAGMAAADPTNPQSWNRYAYVGNNPLGAVDPMGLADNDCIQDASCTFWTCNDIMSFCHYRCDPNIDPIDCEDPAGDANSYFNSIVNENEQQAEALYQRMVDCGQNPGSCDTPATGYSIWVHCGGTFTDVDCLPPDEAISGSSVFYTNLLYPGLAPGDVPVGTDFINCSGCKGYWQAAPGFVGAFAASSVVAGTSGYAAYDISQVEEGAIFGTRLGGNNPLFNSNDFLRVGWSYIREADEYTFRVGGDLLNGGHINLWPPSWWF